MATLTRSLIMKAPVEKIFAFMDDPFNLLGGVWPSLNEVKNVEKLPNGGVCYQYSLKVLGMTIAGTSEDIEHVPNVRTVSKSTGGMDSVATVSFAPGGQGTLVTITYEFTVPVPLVGKLAETVAVKMNEKEVETMLANIKAKMEA